MQPDVAPGGLAHSMSSPELRWPHWQAWAVMEARRAGRVADLTRLKARHCERLRRLTAAEIGWPAILRGELDDPRVGEVEFERRFALALERRRIRQRGVATLRGTREISRKRGD